MSSIKPSHLLIVMSSLLALAGCGDKNSKVVFSPESGHSSDWISTHKTSARSSVESCVDCHGENYDGGVSKVSCMSQSAVSGFSCHVTSPAANLTGCISCHGNGPFGTTAPNRMSAHAKHVALTVCGTCHGDAGSGTADHGKADATGGRRSATVVLSADFNIDSASGTVAYNADGTCSNVSCHGGKVTPVWTGSLDIVANDNDLCLKCHEPGTARYNSFYSGVYSTKNIPDLHTYHIEDQGAKCTDCHNIGTLTNYQQHYGGIATKSLTSPEKTIGNGNNGSKTLPTQIGNYDSASKTCSNVNCHSFSAPWIQ